MKFNQESTGNLRFTIPCPYCGNLNTMLAQDWSESGLMYCDIEDSNGCDRKFAYEYEVNWIGSAYKLENSQ